MLSKKRAIVSSQKFSTHFSVPDIGTVSAAVICSEYSDISNFSSPFHMLAAGIELGVNEFGTEFHVMKKMIHLIFTLKIQYTNFYVQNLLQYILKEDKHPFKIH